MDEALEAAQLLVRQPPQAVGEVEPGQSAQPRQRLGLGVSVQCVHAELGKQLETREAVSGQRCQIAVRDAEVTEAGEVVEAARGQPGLVAHQLGALDGERHGAAGGDHAEVSLVVVRVLELIVLSGRSTPSSKLCGYQSFIMTLLGSFI